MITIKNIALSVSDESGQGLRATGKVILIDGYQQRTVKFESTKENGLQFWGRGDDKAEPTINAIEKAILDSNYFGMGT